MPVITDWIMVGITAAYVIATIFICIFNGKSAKATREQVAESKRQYEDKKRLEIMPYIQFERTKVTAEYEMNLILDSGDGLTGTYVLLTCMKNIGNGTAKDIAYTYEWDNFTKKHDKGAFPIQALSSGDSQRIKIDFTHTIADIKERKACFYLRYRDLLENEYTQKVYFKFLRNQSATLTLTEFSTSSPAFVHKDITVSK